MQHYQQTPLRFQCTQCGECCTGSGNFFVYLRKGEARRMRAHLGLSRAWFRRRYLHRLDDGELVLSSHADGRSIFLQADGRCRVYAVRPQQCRTYPWWPEVVRSRSAWQAEGRRCEGIGHGPVMPLAKLRAILKQQA